MQWLEDRNGRPLPVAPGVRAHFTDVKIVAITPQSADVIQRLLSVRRTNAYKSPNALMHPIKKCV
jgi:hypothetical protein